MHPHGPRPQQKLSLPGIRQVIAVASGKGGVGKSTVAVNLAAAFARLGLKAGLLDADIYGPSAPHMMGISEEPGFDAEKRLIPLEAWGVKVMSIGFIVEDGTANIWRGPMASSALRTLMGSVWGTEDEPLDVLVIDLPPGTGDIQLTIAQQVSVAGAVVVTTPQDVALADAIKAKMMFDKVNIPVLGAEDLGISLTESYAMVPGASVSGIYLAHPQARYFSVGRIARDQVEDYAARKGVSPAEAERWLRPNLAYEPDPVAV